MKQPPWKKRFCIGLLLSLLCYMLLVEFGALVLFFAVVFGLSALWVYGRSWWKKRRNRLHQEEEDTAWAEAERAAAVRRREACREARYRPEERERVEARILQDLGPIAAWGREETGSVLDIDVALVPPTENLPFWKAVTVGAGACVIEAGGYQISPERIELAMALPPDWDPEKDWPGRILRSVAWYCLITKGFIGYFIYRGLTLAGAGFAGAVADDEFPGMPELALTAMLRAPSVKFYWVLPLLKPELDYVCRRGLCNLERRIPASCPWVDPERKPWADPAAWFQEDIAPFIWSEDGERFCLGLETGALHQELFLRAGLDGTGWDWERLVREYLRQYQPDDGPFVEYACEEWYFFAVSKDREILERLALGLSDLLRDDRAGVRRLLVPDGR
nr:Imm51 family immunity protein [uncultured Oscillibacter sp.]